MLDNTLLTKLDVYRSAIEHLAFVFESAPKLPANLAGLGEQWCASAVSVAKHIAQAIGSASERARSSHFAVACGEAMECAEILDLVRLLDVVPVAELERAKSLLAGLGTVSAQPGTTSERAAA